MTDDIYSKLFGGPSKEEILGDIRLEVWKAFDSVNSTFDNLGDRLSDPVFLKDFLRGMLIRVVAEANISDIIAHEPSGGFGAVMYPKHEAIQVIREEMMRAVSGEQNG